MSLAFLAKKSWHTANLRNVEKVWIAEQKHAAEEKKVEELRKNIEEERQLQELRQLQASQGNKEATQERLDWMYEGPSSAREKSTEEYLLGKEYKEEGSGSTAGADAADLSTTTKYGSLALSKAALPANDTFSRLNEDPMMVIRMRQKAARESVLKNPVKMNKIKAQVDKLRDDKKARKKARKAVKKERKHARREEKRRLKKKRKRDESSDDSDGSALSDEDELDEKARRPASASHHERRQSRSHERSYPRYGSQGLNRRDRGPVDRRAAPQEVRRRSRSAPRGRSRTPSPWRDRHHRHHTSSRSRSPIRQKRDHQARSRSGERQRKEVKPEMKRSARSPAPYPADRHSRTPPRRERTGDRVDRHWEHSSRSPEDARGRQRPSRNPENSHGHQHRSRSLEDTRGRDRGHRHQVSGKTSTRQERGSRRSSSRDRHRTKWSMDDGRGSERDRRQESSSGRRKPLDTEGKYGLISHADAVESKEVDKTSLGPNAKYLAKAREAKRQEEEERHRKLAKTSTSHGEAGRSLTTEEKQRLAAQMVEDAKQRDEYITKSAARKKDELDGREQQATSDNPEFLQKMRSSAYLSGESSMGDRLRRNKHYIQKNADASNFLSK